MCSLRLLFSFSFPFCFRTKERTKQIYEKISIWLRRKLWWSWWSWWWCWRDDNDSEWLWQYFPCDRRTRITWDLWLSLSLSFSRLDKNDMWSPLMKSPGIQQFFVWRGKLKINTFLLDYLYNEAKLQLIFFFFCFIILCFSFSFVVFVV